VKCAEKVADAPQTVTDWEAVAVAVGRTMRLLAEVEAAAFDAAEELRPQPEAKKVKLDE
jgi:hypothetical protein